MAKMTTEERLEQPRAQLKKLNNILKSLKAMKVEGGMLDDRIETLIESVRVERDVLSARIKLYEVEKATA